MTHAEFEKLTGKKIDLDLYRSVIEPAYMASNFDKEQFATAWDTTGHFGVITNLTDRIEVLTNIVKEYQDERKQLGYFLADNSHREEAIKLLGEREYIKHQIKAGRIIMEADKDLILNLIG